MDCSKFRKSPINVTAQSGMLSKKPHSSIAVIIEVGIINLLVDIYFWNERVMKMNAI